jgi:cytochrome b561
MALLFCCQFTSALLRFFVPDSEIGRLFWSTHVSVGFTIWVLALSRGAWGLANLRNRPSHGKGVLGMAAAAGHLGLYILMIVVPSLAILRAIGNTRGLTVYGMQLVAAGGERNVLLTTPGNVAHALLGWALLLLILGHIGMVLIHTFVWRDGTLDRMTRTATASGRTQQI